MLTTKALISLAVTALLISPFVLISYIVCCLFFLYLKFQAYKYFKWLYSLVCVRPGQKPRNFIFHVKVHVLIVQHLPLFLASPFQWSLKASPHLHLEHKEQTMKSKGKTIYKLIAVVPILSDCI